jgi:hypothetical protein
MEQMKLAALRKEDETRDKSSVVPMMQQAFKQAPPRLNSRDTPTRQWPTPQAFLPPRPQSTPPWGAQTKVEFRDVSGVQKKSEVPFVNKRREGDTWDRDASRAFHLQMKALGERVEVETDDVLTCQPDYDAFSQGTTPTKFTKLPTSTALYPIAIGIELNGINRRIYLVRHPRGG